MDFFFFFTAFSLGDKAFKIFFVLFNELLVNVMII